MVDRRPAAVQIAASILDSDLAALGDEIRRAEAAGADRIHLDVMDGHFVPNITFGWKTIEAVRRVTEIPFDAHLMISEPGRWTPQFLDAGLRLDHVPRRGRAPQVLPGAGDDPRGGSIGGTVGEARDAAQRRSTRTVTCSTSCS